MVGEELRRGKTERITKGYSPLDRELRPFFFPW
jgi:hypothetical protein